MDFDVGAEGDIQKIRRAGSRKAPRGSLSYATALT